MPRSVAPRPIVRTALLAAILLIGFLLRMQFTPHEGFVHDVQTNQGWAHTAVELGLARSYVEQVDGTMLPNYPPLSLMFFATSGYLHAAFGDGTFDHENVEWRIMIKLPSILVDLLTAVLLYCLVRRSTGEWGGLLAAAVYAFHPAVIFESAVWGQTDTLYTFFGLASLVCCLYRRWFWMGAFAAAALLSKLQALAFFPVLAVAMEYRIKPLVQAVAGGVITMGVVLLPFIFGGTVMDVWNMYRHLPGFHPSLSSSAYNFWWTLFGDASGERQSSDIVFDLYFTYRTIGLALWITSFGIVLWFLRRPLRAFKQHAVRLEALSLAAAGGTLSFFLFNVEMHERYLFPFLAIALPAAMLTKRMAWIYITTSTFFFLNLLGVLPTLATTRALYDEFPSFDGFVASGLVFCFVLLVPYSRKRAMALMKTKKTTVA